MIKISERCHNFFNLDWRDKERDFAKGAEDDAEKVSQQRILQ